jgi:putative phage-type endonuclease
MAGMNDLIQRSPEWFTARCGSLGASAVHEAVARTKSGYSASRANRMATLVLERLTGVSQESYQSKAMLDGIENEPAARAAYSLSRGVDVQEVGLFVHPTIKGTHASPDGLIGTLGALEIKCPQPAAHLATLLGEPIPERYFIQMQWQMRCAGRQWCDYVSYSPAFPDDMRLHVQTVKFDQATVTKLEAEVREFLAEVEAKVDALRNRFAKAA